MVVRGIPALAILLAAVVGVLAQDSKPKTLLIGSTGLGDSDAKDKAALKTLKKFIKEETGLDNEIQQQRGWREVADDLAADKVHIGVFQGPEFAWAKAKHPKLEPLALGINVERYPVAYLVAKKGGKVSKVADLEGKDLALASAAPRFLFSFLRKETGKNPEKYFKALKKSENVEDALDDVVDGNVPAAIVDKGALEAFRRRKPGRFKQLEPVARSEPFPPVVIAYHPRAGQVAPRQVRGGAARLLQDRARPDDADPVPADPLRIGARGLRQGADLHGEGVPSPRQGLHQVGRTEGLNHVLPTTGSGGAPRVAVHPGGVGRRVPRRPLHRPRLQ